MSNSYKNIDRLISNVQLGKKSSKEFLLQYYSKHNNYHLNSFKVIHITGTAGKGSTCKMIAKGLEENNYNVGLFTSPHTIEINERIQINSKCISNKDLDKLLDKYFNLFLDLLFTEALLLCAVDYFIENNVDYVVFEVFVGGRYDLTNIFNSVATIITSIGLDHQHLLGSTKKEILNDKLGIIRENVPLFTSINSKLISKETNKIGAIYKLVRGKYPTNLIADYQERNAKIAQQVLKYLGVDENKISRALQNVDNIGRFQFIKNNILVDCAHNELSLKKLSNELCQMRFNKFDKKVVLFALSNHKDLKDFEFFLSQFDEIILTKSSIFKAQDLKDSLHSSNFLSNLNCKYCENSIKKYQEICKNLDKHTLLVITGSIFLVSDILKYEKTKEN